MFYFSTIPKWFQQLNRSLVWSIPTKEKKLFLTFDDGPHETATPFVLDQLKKYNAKATFFCIGKNVKAHTEIYNRILHEGHSVGNHTYNHLNGWKAKKDAYIKDIKLASACIHSNLFRPPYGKISPFTVTSLKKLENFEIIMWHVLSGDFDKNITTSKCIQNVVQNAEEGSIIIFHDSAKAWEKMSIVLPEILDFFSCKGFSFESINII